MLLSLCLYHRQLLCVNRHRHDFSLQLTFYCLQDWFFLSLLFFPSLPAGLYQSVLQEHLALRLPHQHRGRPEHPGRLLFGPVPVCWGPQTQQEATAQLPVSPVLQQRPLHQRLPAGERRGRRCASVASGLSSGSWTVFSKASMWRMCEVLYAGGHNYCHPPQQLFHWPRWSLCIITEKCGTSKKTDERLRMSREVMPFFSCFCLLLFFAALCIHFEPPG